MRGLSIQERKFTVHYCKTGDAEAAKAHAGYGDNSGAHQLLRRPEIAAAVRAEVVRLMATEGAQIGFRSLKRIAQDTTLPAAAQVAAAKALLQGAGLLESPEKAADSKPLTDYSREELRDYINSKQDEIAQLEGELAARAVDITPIRDSEPTSHDVQPIDPFG